MKRRSLALAAMAAMLIAGCGTDATPTSGTPADPAPSTMFNATDVMFLQMMIAHHRPAEEMLRLARTRAKREEVKTLAAAVEVTQADETKTMTDWLNSWNQPLVSDAHPDAHAAHGGLPPNGEEQMATLKNATDAEFDVTFLNIFIGHQHLAVELARMEVAGGSDRQTVDLANRIDQSRRAQIQLMLGYAA